MDVNLQGEEAAGASTADISHTGQTNMTSFSECFLILRPVDGLNFRSYNGGTSCQEHPNIHVCYKQIIELS